MSKNEMIQIIVITLWTLVVIVISAISGYKRGRNESEEAIEMSGTRSYTENYHRKQLKAQIMKSSTDTLVDWLSMNKESQKESWYLDRPEQMELIKTEEKWMLQELEKRGVKIYE